MKKSFGKRHHVKKSPPQPASRPRVFHLECKSDPKEIKQIEPFLNKVNKAANLDDGTFYRLLVSTTEAVNNAIIHGNKCDPHRFVHVTISLEKNSLTLRVKDEGKGFRLDQLTNPIEEKNLLKTSGRGIFLMRSMMEKVTFHTTDEGTVVELVIDLKLLQ